MRMMLRWRIPVDCGNEALPDGSWHAALDKLFAAYKPEATYYWLEDGERSGMAVFEMSDSAEIPAIAEPLFHAAEVELDLIPVMTEADLRKGLEKVHAELD